MDTSSEATLKCEHLDFSYGPLLEVIKNHPAWMAHSDPVNPVYRLPKIALRKLGQSNFLSKEDIAAENAFAAACERFRAIG